MNYVLCDLETSSLKPASAEILTADFIVLNSELVEIDKRSFKVRPRIWGKEAEDASKIHGISREEAYRFNAYQDEMNRMFDFLLSFNRCHLVAHNNRVFRSSYDQTILRFHALDNGFYFDFGQSFPEAMYISTHSLAKFKEVPSKLDLASLCNYFKIAQNKHHSSEDDVRVTSEIFKILMKDTNLDEFYRFENKEDINDTESTSKVKKLRQTRANK